MTKLGADFVIVLLCMLVRCFVRLASTKAKLRPSNAKLWLRHAQRDMKKKL